MITYKVVEPKDSFYGTFTPEQILDIAINIDTCKEIPLQYSYVGEGADFWDHHAERLMNEATSNVLKGSCELVESRLNDLSKLTGHRKVTIIDLGPGNGKPIGCLRTF